MYSISVAHPILWRICSMCATEMSYSVAHLAYMCHRYVNFCGARVHAPQNLYFSGDDSVAHRICATESQNMCATDSQFPSSDMDNK